MTAKSSEKTAARERMALTGENYTQPLAEVRAKRDRPSYAAPRDAKVTS